MTSSEKTEKEIARMEKLSLGSPELGVIRTYVEWILDLPWNVIRTEDNLDLDPCAQDTRRGSLRAGKGQGPDHRVSCGIRHESRTCAARCSASSARPERVKHLIARSIARALGRKFVRTSLGGRAGRG